MGWRSGPYHFASSSAKMYLMSAPLEQVLKMVELNGDDNIWTVEDQISLGKDLREPYFWEIGNKLHFSFFQAGTDPIAF